MKKKIFLGLVLIFVIIQFFRIDKINPPVIQEQDFITVTAPPQEIAEMIKTSCYDCHSFESTYLWYSNIAPVSWWLKHHVDEAREELNFSEWGTYTAKRKDHKLEECTEEIEEGEMPLKPYLWTHGDAKLTKEDRQKLIDWFKYLRVKG